MINTHEFGQHLRRLGFNFYSGVSCTFLKDLINDAVNGGHYVMAAHEADAVAICAGAALGGQKSVVLMPNAGLAHAASPLTTLNPVFRIPVLGFVGLRGEGSPEEEPQHALVGAITTQLLDIIQVPWELLSRDTATALEQLERAGRLIAQDQPFFFVVRKETFGPVALEERKRHQASSPVKEGRTRADARPFRRDVLEKINELKDEDTLQLATTGRTSAELYEIEDAPNNFYMVGSLGCISSLGLGLALVQPAKDVVVLDGDGSLLMGLGAMPTNAYYKPANLLHILLDNNAHDSTGGQATISDNVDFVGIAAASGYPVSLHAHDTAELEQFYREWKANRQLTFITMKIAKGSKREPGRLGVKPCEAKERLMKFISGSRENRKRA
jgi:phosphonopyruvate decarboxylase